MNEKQKVYWNVSLFVLAVIVRILFLQVWGGLDQQIRDSMSDQYIYLDIADNLANNGQFVVSTDTFVANANEPTSIVPPLYPLFLGLVFKLCSHNLIVVRLLQVLFSAFLVNLVFAIGLHAYNEKVAIVAGILTAIYPSLVMFVRPIMSEGIFFPLLASLVWTTYKLDQIKPLRRYYFLWGGIAAVAVLTRTEIIFLVALLLVYLVYRQFKRTQRVNISGFSTLALTSFLILLPYFIYNFTAHGTYSFFPNARWKFWEHTCWTEIRKYPEWEGTNLPERKIVPDWESLNEVERDNYLWNMSLDFIRSNPEIFFVQRLKSFVWGYPVIPRELFSGDNIVPDGFEYGPTSLDDIPQYVTAAEQVRVWTFRLIFILAVGGILITLQHRISSAYILMLVLLWNIFHSMLFVGTERLRLQIDFCLIIFAAFLIVYIVSRQKVWKTTSNEA